MNQETHVRFPRGAISSTRKGPPPVYINEHRFDW
jgi:hypothetical protein